jgi:glycosyltransferase involved in cell wall biosynthesis
MQRDDEGAPVSRLVVPGLVSVLINNFNYGRYVVQAARSALEQSYPHVEVIVIDDGSTDDSLARLAELTDPRLTVISQPNQGQASACNHGWRRASGQWILFLDADDLIDSDTVERAIGCWRPGMVKVQFALRVIDAAGAPTGAMHPPELQDHGCVQSVLRYGLYASPPGSGNLFARDFVDAVMPIDPEPIFRSGADSWCILMAPFFGQIHSLESAGGSYRVDRPAGVDALRVIGNINARASSNLVKTMECTSAVFAALRRRGLISLFRPALPSPPLLRAWCIARLEDDLPRGVALWNGLPGIATVCKSVMGWRAYSLRKKFIYIGYLGVCLLLPTGAAQRAVKAFSHAFEK